MAADKFEDLGFQSFDDLGFAPEQLKRVLPASSVGKLESAARGAAQGVTFGNADEITAALLAAKAGVSGEASGLDEILNAYRKERDESRAAYAAAQEENPWTYGLSEFAGGAVLPLGAIGTAGKAASFGQKALEGAKIGALAGGLSGLGTSQADLTKGEVGQAARDTIESAAIGAGLGAGVSSVLPAVGNKIKSAVGEFKSPQEFMNVLNKYRGGGEIGTRASSEAITEKAQGLAKNIGKTLAEVKSAAGAVGGEARAGGEIVPAMSKYEELVEKIKGIVPASADEEKLLAKYRSMLDKLVGKTTKIVDGEAQVVYERPDVLPEEIQKTKDALGKILFRNKDLPYEGEQVGHEIRTGLDDLLVGGLDEASAAKLEASNVGYQKGLEAQAKIGGLPASSGKTLEARMMYDKQVNDLVNVIEGSFAKPGATESVDLKNAFKIAKDNVEGINKSLMSLTQDTEEIANLTLLKNSQLDKLKNLEDQVKKQAMDIHTTRIMLGESPFGGEGIVRKVTGISGQAAKLQVAKGVGKTIHAVETAAPERMKKIMTGVYNASPEVLQNAVDVLAQKGSPFTDKLRAAVAQPGRKRNALLFMLMQQPDFRSDVGSFFDAE